MIEGKYEIYGVKKLLILYTIFSIYTEKIHRKYYDKNLANKNLYNLLFKLNPNFRTHLKYWKLVLKKKKELKSMTIKESLLYFLMQKVNIDRYSNPPIFLHTKNTDNMAVKTYKQLERNEDKTFGITAKYEINSNNNLSPDTKKVVQFFKPLKNDWNTKGSKISLYASVWFEIEDKEPIIIKGKKTYLHLQEIKDGELIKNLNSKTKSFITGYEENKPKKISVLQQALFWLSKYRPKFPIFSPELRKISNNKDNPFNDINTHFRKGGYLENDPELRKKSNNS